MGKFEPGNKMATGRPKGSPNRRTAEVTEIAERLGINPLETLLLFAKGDWEALGYDTGVMIKESKEGESTFMEYTISPELRAQCAREACKYLYPQKKSVEHSHQSPLEGMSASDKLEAMKQAVQMLEGEIGANSGGLSREVKEPG